MPTGPPILCAETLSASRPAPPAPEARRTAAKSMRHVSVGRDRVHVHRHAVRAASAASSATGWIVPTSLFAQRKVSRATDAGSVGERRVERRRAGAPDRVERQPLDDRALVPLEPLDRVDRGVVLSAGHEDARAAGTPTLRAQSAP